LDGTSEKKKVDTGKFWGWRAGPAKIGKLGEGKVNGVGWGRKDGKFYSPFQRFSFYFFHFVFFFHPERRHETFSD
jgi:hypothetical protein